MIMSRMRARARHARMNQRAKLNSVVNKRHAKSKLQHRIGGPSKSRVRLKRCSPRRNPRRFRAKSFFPFSPSDERKQEITQRSAPPRRANLYLRPGKLTEPLSRLRAAFL